MKFLENFRKIPPVFGNDVPRGTFSREFEMFIGPINNFFSPLENFLLPEIFLYANYFTSKLIKATENKGNFYATSFNHCHI